MTENVTSGINFIFNCMLSFFQLSMQLWPLAIFILGGLLTLVIKLYINSRQDKS